MIKRCCMKQDIKDCINLLFNYTLISVNSISNLEAIVICVFRFINILSINLIIFHFNIVEYLLTHALNGVIQTHYILILSLYINTIILIAIFNELYETLHAIVCRCE